MTHTPNMQEIEKSAESFEKNSSIVSSYFGFISGAKSLLPLLEERDKELAEKSRQIEQLREALGAAVSAIKAWHNADEVWDIYFNHAPEMKSIRTALQNTKPINQ